MSFPKDAKVVDLMMGIPVSATNTEWYTPYLPLLLDHESREAFKMPAQYMFKDIPVLPSDSDYVDYTVKEMDRYGIRRGMVGYWEGSEGVKRA
ncbi:MAG: amidohydrolase, partial [Steroidobacteraceae bacterium]